MKQSQTDVVESATRIYSVPTEKVRVWTSWLMLVSEEAGAWHQWLHNHVDMIFRTSKQLKVVEKKISKTKRLVPLTQEDRRRILSTLKWDEDSYDEIKYPDGSKDVSDIEEALNNAMRKSAKESKAVLATSTTSTIKVTEETKTDETGDEEESTDKEEVEEEREEVEASELVEQDEEGEEEDAQEATDTTENIEDPRLTGGADEPTEETADDDEALLELGASKSLVKSIKGQSTMQQDASFAKKEEQPTTEPLYQDWPLGVQWEPLGIQGRIQVEEKKDDLDAPKSLGVPRNAAHMEKLLKDFTHQAIVYRSYYKHWMETADRAIKEIVGREVLLTAKQRGMLKEENLQRSLTEALKCSLMSGKDKTRGAASKTPTPVKGITWSAASKAQAPSKMSSNIMALASRVGKADFINEMAQATEDIPYFFYLRAEPDIGLAIEANDEEVILPDHEEESIYGNYERLRFSLADKPGKSGESWI